MILFDDAFFVIIEGRLSNSYTVFPPIEAPGAKEMVLGASVFHRRAPNFKINLVNRDIKMSLVLSHSKKKPHIEHKYMYKF